MLDYTELDAIPYSDLDLGGHGTKTVVVTPLDAHNILKLNVNNRKISPSTVARYQAMMERGQWDWADGDTQLKFGEDGTLMNGQHRLTAQVRANVTGAYDVRTGVPEGSFKVMDAHAPRRVADYFKGVEQPTNVSALANIICRVSAGYHTGRGVSMANSRGDIVESRVRNAPTRTDVIDFAEGNYDELLRFVRLGYRIYKQHGRGSIAAIAFALYMLERNGHDDVQQFVEAYVSGEDSAGVTKQTILKKFVRGDFRPDQTWCAGVTLMTYDSWKSGRPLRSIGRATVDKRYTREVELFNAGSKN